VSEKDEVFALTLLDQQATGTYLELSVSVQHVPTVGDWIRKYSGTILEEDMTTSRAVTVIKINWFRSKIRIFSFFAIVPILKTRYQ